MKIRKIGNWEYWYDRSYRCWFTMPVDDEGNQLKESINAYTRREIEDIIRSEQKDEQNR